MDIPPVESKDAVIIGDIDGKVNELRASGIVNMC